MAKHQKQLTFTFVNPNDTKSFEKQFRRILIDRLTAAYRQKAMAI